MRKIQLLIMFLLTSGVVYAQQDALQSQYLFNGIYVNPAYAGYKETLNVNAFYRSQWTGITGAPTTTSVAIDDIANDGNVGLALQLSSDKLGAQSNTAAYANYAYRLRMNADGSARLALGLGVGLEQLGINGALLQPDDPEFNQPTGTQSMTIPDGRMGVYYSDNSFFAGLSADNLIAQYINVKNNSYIPQPKPNFYLTTGMLVPISEDTYLKPSILLMDDRAGPTSLDINTFLLFGQSIWIGASYRTGVKLYNKSYLQSDLSNQNAVAGIVEIFVNENFRVGYSYDYSVGPLQNYSGGTHELSISYYFKTPKSRMQSPRYF
jgi:type IX secretion system PorP/SprF family membrane protein